MLNPKPSEDYQSLSVESWPFIQKKIETGHALSGEVLFTFMQAVVDRKLLDVHIAAFLTVCITRGMSESEIADMTLAMVNVGRRLQWPFDRVVDLHCVGGVPGNRTTLIVVSIVAAFGLAIPKTSSRSITSPSGTADTMEVLASVNLNIEQIKQVVQREKGCIVWGGATDLSPADDVIIRIERKLNLDSPAQMVASVLSKKVAAGSTHVLLDIPVGETAKIRSIKEAKKLKNLFQKIGRRLGLMVKVVITNGQQPVGYGIGPALEIRDVLAILKNEPHVNHELKERSLQLAGLILEFSPDVKKGQGKKLAEEILISGQAWKKFQAICEAQGGMKKTISVARFQQPFAAQKAGKVKKIDNIRLATIAKLAGAPMNPAAGLNVHAFLGDQVKRGQSLFTVHAGTEDELQYVFEYLAANTDIYTIA